jgi:drug/metabolite transporter (DMT)-like permease
MESWMLAVLGAALLYAVSNTLNKHLITKLRSSFGYLYIWSIGMTAASFAFIAMTEPLVLPECGAWLFIAISAAAGALGYVLFFWALDRGDVSSLPIISMRPVLAVAMSFFIIGEWHNLGFLGFSALAFLGGFASTWYEGAPLKKIFSLSNTVFWGFFATIIFWNVADIVANPALKTVSVANFVAWRQLAFMAVLVFLAPLLLRKEKIVRKRVFSILPLTVICVVLSYIAFLFTNVGMAHSPATSITLLASMSVFVVIIAAAVSRIAPEMIAERHTARTYLVRFLGALLVLSAVLGVALWG